MSELSKFGDLVRKKEVKLPGTEHKGEPAADKAEIMKRLAALVDPYTKALAAKGPDVHRLQALFAKIKACLGKRQFAEAAVALDELEALLYGTPPPPHQPDAPHKHPPDVHHPSHKHPHDVHHQPPHHDAPAPPYDAPPPHYDA